MRWGKGSETPSFLMLRPRERGSLRPFSPPQEGVSDPFSHRKRENPLLPKIPLAKIPLAQKVLWIGRKRTLRTLEGKKGWLHWRNMGLHRCKPHLYKSLLGDSLSLCPKDLLHLCKKTSSQLCCFDLFPKHSGLQPQTQPKIFTLPALQKNCDIFSNLRGDLALNVGEVLVNFQQSPFPMKQSTKHLQKFGAKFGTKIRKEGLGWILLLGRTWSNGKLFQLWFPTHSFLSGKDNNASLLRIVLCDTGADRNSEKLVVGGRIIILRKGGKGWQVPEHTRKRNKPENTGNRSSITKICDFGCVSFSGLFWRPL